MRVLPNDYRNLIDSFQQWLLGAQAYWVGRIKGDLR